MEILKHLTAYVDFVWKDAFLVFAIIWIYEGTRILVAGESKGRGLGMLLPGIFIVIFMGSLSLSMPQSMDALNKTVNNSKTSELPKDWAPTIPPDVREKSSRSYAAVVFVSSGKLISYFDHTGSSQLYCPNEQDIARRDETVVVRTKLQQVSEDAYSALFSWLLWGIVASLLGWFEGRRKKSQTV